MILPVKKFYHGLIAARTSVGNDDYVTGGLEVSPSGKNRSGTFSDSMGAKKAIIKSNDKVSPFMEVYR